jgi:hypothetical protein
MAKGMQRVFEIDRRMELRLRLAAKRAKTMEKSPLIPLYNLGTPEREVVHRIIERVRRL